MKFLRIMSVLLLLALALVLVSCEQEEENLPSETQESVSDTEAQEEDTNSSTEEEKGVEYNCDEGIHAYIESNTCEICGYTIPVTAGLKFVTYNKEECGVRPSPNLTSDVYIPAIYNGRRVVAIEENAFASSRMTGVHIPCTVTRISKYAFHGCGSLKEIILPSLLTTIEPLAFSNCHTLERMTVPKGVTSIGQSFLSNCFAVVELNVEEGNEVYHSDGSCIIETASKRLIAGCNKSVIPSDGSVTCIGEEAFAFCRLTALEIPDSITRVESSSLPFADDLAYNEYGDACYLGNAENPYVLLVKLKTKDITECNINNKTKIIYDSAFDSCREISEIVIPDSVVSINKNAFYNCVGVSSIVIGNGVENIGSSAFGYSSAVKSVTVGKNVKSIGDYAFLNCSKMEKLTFEGSEAEWEKIEKGESWDYCHDHVVPVGEKPILEKIEYEIEYKNS